MLEIGKFYITDMFGINEWEYFVVLSYADNLLVVLWEDGIIAKINNDIELFEEKASILPLL